MLPALCPSFPHRPFPSLSAPGWASEVAQTVKNLPAMRETQVGSLDQEDPLGRATWEMPRTEHPGGLQSMGVTDHHRRN